MQIHEYQTKIADTFRLNNDGTKFANGRIRIEEVGIVRKHLMVAVVYESTSKGHLNHWRFVKEMQEILSVMFGNAEVFESSLQHYYVSKVTYSIAL